MPSLTGVANPSQGAPAILAPLAGAPAYAPMSEYCDIDDIKDLGSMPAEDVDALEDAYPGIVSRLTVAISGMFDVKLRKRYAVPFESPYPMSLKMAVAQWVSKMLWSKRGFDPSGLHSDAIKDDHLEAKEWLDEAANGETGMIELPLKADAPSATGVARGGPLSYSEASPYTAGRLQRIAGRLEDSNG